MSILDYFSNGDGNSTNLSLGPNDLLPETMPQNSVGRLLQNPTDLYSPTTKKVKRFDKKSNPYSIDGLTNNSKSNTYSIDNLLNSTSPSTTLSTKQYSKPSKKTNPYSIDNLLNSTSPSTTLSTKQYSKPSKKSNPYSIDNLLNSTSPSTTLTTKRHSMAPKKQNPYSVDNMLDPRSANYLLNTDNSKELYGELAKKHPKLIFKKKSAKEKSGMNEVSKILLDKNRVIKFTKKATTPEGAAEMVAKHNLTKAQKWHLNLINPNGPIEKNNFSDVNGDGVPDIIILNENNSPVYVNGITTCKSNSMKKLDQIESSKGDSAYSKFKKKVFSAKNTALTEMGLNNADKIQQMGLLNKAMSEIWHDEIIQKVYDKLNLTTQKDINKAKKTPAYKNELMATVDENIAQHRDDRTYYHSLLTHAMVDVQNNRTPTEKNSNPYSIGLF